VESYDEFKAIWKMLKWKAAEHSPSIKINYTTISCYNLKDLFLYSFLMILESWYDTNNPTQEEAIRLCM
jgi:hypothetical protein